MNLIIKIKGKKVELTVEEAKQIHKELSELFEAASGSPVSPESVLPVFPPSPIKLLREELNPTYTEYYHENTTGNRFMCEEGY